LAWLSWSWSFSLYIENQLDSLPGSASKVCVVGGWVVESKTIERKKLIQPTSNRKLLKNNQKNNTILSQW
jgi:hypothetical protein